MRAPGQSPARLTAAATLLALCGAVSASAPASVMELAECLNTNAPQLAELADCGHVGSVEFCLGNRLPRESQLCTSDVIAQCFIDAGCQPEEALIEAVWTIKRCEHGVSNGEVGELRRRKDSDSDSDSDSATETSTKTTAKTTKATSTTDASTTSDAASSASSASPASASTTSTAASTSTSSNSKSLQTKAATDSTYTGTTTTSLVCETTTTISTTTCPTQSTGSNSGKEMSCFSTIQSFPTCAAGLMCDTDNNGDITCMVAQNSLSAAGVVIAIVFGLGLVIAITTMCFFCCRERRQDARMNKAAEAAAIARQAAIDSKRAATTGARNVGSSNLSQSYSADSQPLMHSSVSNQDLRHSETSGDIAGPNPFADQHGLR